MATPKPGPESESETHSIVLTEDVFLQYRERQDSALHMEFGVIHNKFQNLEEVVGVMHDKIQNLEEVVGVMHDKIHNLEEVVVETNTGLRNLREEMGEMKSILARMEVRKSNKRKERPWHTIDLPGIYHPSLGFQQPQNPPVKVADFWRLQQPDQRPQLIYLIGFYDIQYQYWTMDERDEMDFDSASNSDSSSSSRPSLKEAVQNSPTQAINALADYLGIDIGKIREAFQKLAEYRAHPQVPIKRGVDEDVMPGIRLKSQDLPQHNILPPHTASPTQTKSSEQTRIEWDVERKEAHLKALNEKMQLRPTRQTSSATQAFTSPTQAFTSPTQVITPKKDQDQKARLQ